jgi:OMF family outer membrane factor
LAELARKTAMGNVVNPRLPTSFQMLDNTKRQVTFLPNEIFGGAAGTFREIAFGQQYVSTLSIQPQFDIVNLASVELIKSAKINQELVENQQKIAEQKLYDQLNAIYFNILSFQGQKEILVENIAIAEKIKGIVERKFKEGIARKQELNEAEVNVISLQDKLGQIEMNCNIQTQSLALFFENSLEPTLTQSVWAFEKDNAALETNNTLTLQNYALQLKMAQQDLKVAKYQQLPTLGFVSSLGWQHNSNDGFFNKKSKWLGSNYLGLKINWDLPTTVQKLSSTYTKELSLATLRNNAEHAQKENDTKNKLLLLEYAKAVAQLSNMKKIYALKEDTYSKNYNQFMENILGLDKLLLSQNDVLMSKLNIISTLATIGFNKNKIEINNKF